MKLNWENGWWIVWSVGRFFGVDKFRRVVCCDWGLDGEEGLGVDWIYFGRLG